jgi:hypothetical protein
MYSVTAGFICPTGADCAGSTRCFAGCDGDKTKKPSRNGVTACCDSWITAALEEMACHLVNY